MFRSKLVVLLIFALNLVCYAQEFIELKINAVDGLNARVEINDTPLGETGTFHKFDISKYRKPVGLDVVLIPQAKGYVTSYHRLTLPDDVSQFESAPLEVYKILRVVELRVDPGAELIKIERNGTTELAGSNSQLNLEVKNRLQPFQALPLTLVLEQPGYLPTRITDVPPEIWGATVYPAEGKPPLKMVKDPSLAGWWTRTTRESLFPFIVIVLLFISGLALARVRYHYLKRIETAHRDLKVWVERLNAFVDGSQNLAAPIDPEKMAQEAFLQARRLTGANRSLFRLMESDILESEPGELSTEKAAEYFAWLEEKNQPLRIDSVKHSKFPPLYSTDHSLAGVPLMFKGEYKGALLLTKPAQNYFSVTDENALMVLAFQLAGAAERVKLHADTVEAYEKLAESEAQLIQSAKMAAVGQLAAGVAHELNTPLGAISMGLEMGQNLLHKNPDKAKKRLQLAASATEKAEKIVSKLLYYSREAKVDKTVFTLGQLVDDTLNFISFQLDQDGITVTNKADTEQKLEANLHEMNQVLTNLILNARDAVLSGDYKKEIEIESRVENGQVELIVRDYGPGVSADIEGSIFDPFFTTKNMGDGTGLGLSVSSRIVEHHGGTLTLRNQASPTEFAFTVEGASN